MASENSNQLKRRIAAPLHSYEKAIRNNTGLTINRFHFWAAPCLIKATPDPRTAAHLEEATLLLAKLVATAQTALDSHPDSDGLRTAQKTRYITYIIREYITSLDEDLRTYAELHIPFRPGNASRPGRVDLAILRRGKPDILIEIDHGPKSTSEEKLRFIAKEGGIGLWLRWDAWDSSAVY